MSVKKIFIDTDTASDDAVALVCALRDKSFEVVGISTVAGNIPLSFATRNALMSIEYADTYRPPVYVGCEKPLVVELETADQVHGLDGMGDMGTFREPTITPETEHAVDALIRVIDEGDGDIELVTLGPLTNVALAIRRAPEVMKKVPRIYIMGGAHPYSNPHSVCAEFNIMVDPEAADIVCGFSVPFTMVTLEACGEEARIEGETIARLRAKGEIGNFCVDCNQTMIRAAVERTGEEGFGLPDPVTIAVLSRPQMIKTGFSAYTRVELSGSLTRGATVFANPGDIAVDGFGYPNPPQNSFIVTEVDAEQFHQYLIDCM